MALELPKNLPHPLPQPNRDTAPWWEGKHRHELLVQECQSCKKLVHPPQPMCPHCRSLEKGWRKSSGKGKVYSWTVIHRPSYPYFMDKVPYAVVLVEMEEGFRVIGKYGSQLDQLRDGLPVEASFEDVTEEFSLLRFQVAP